MRRRGIIGNHKLAFVATCIFLSLGLTGQSVLVSKILELSDGCFDLDTYIYLPERDLCVLILDIDSVGIAEDDVLNYESYGNYVYKSTLRELLSIDTSICDRYPMSYVDRLEISPRRAKELYEDHKKEYHIPTYNCIENFEPPYYEVDILGFHTYGDSTLYYIEEERLFKIRKRQDGAIIDLYNYIVQDDVLLGQLVKSYHNGMTLRENRELRPDSIDIEVCWLNNDCMLNHTSNLVTSLAWDKYEIKDETKWESIISKIKGRERRRLRE
jgi:hypothetical protein